MVDKPNYSIDSSALIHGWRRASRPKNFGFIWEKLHLLALQGRMLGSIEVLNELERKDDDVFK